MALLSHFIFYAVICLVSHFTVMLVVSPITYTTGKNVLPRVQKLSSVTGPLPPGDGLRRKEAVNRVPSGPT